MKKETVKWVKGRLAAVKDALLFLFLAQFLVVILGLALPVAYQLFIDQIMGRHMYQWQSSFIALLGGVALVMGFVAWIKSGFLNSLSVRNAIAYAAQFLWRLLHLPSLFFTHYFGLELANRMELNTQAANFLVNQAVPLALNGALMLLYLAIMVQYDLTIALIGFAMALINSLAFVLLFPSNKCAELKKVRASASSLALDTIANIETVKTTCQENIFFARIAGFCTLALNMQQAVGRHELWLSSLAVLTEKGAAALLLSGGVWHIVHGYLTVGMLAALQVLLMRFLSPFGRLLNESGFYSLKADTVALDEVLEAPADPSFRDEGAPLDLPSFPGELEFSHVTFGYDPARPVLMDFSFKMQPGERIALVGPVGSGKSTAVKIAGGLYAPKSGRVLYAGRPLSDYSRSCRGKSLAVVDCDPLLFRGTVRENLMLWDPEISQAQMVASAKSACIHEAIISRPDEYDSLLIEGGRNFSAGERKRLEIARALTVNPTLVLLDEALSALDIETEKRLLENLKQLGCSCLIVTNRLNHAADCDRILVLEEGRVVESGTHKQLFEYKGLYRRLIEAQGDEK